MITHEEFIKKHNLKMSDYQLYDSGWLYVYNLRVKDIIIDELPSKIKFTEECNTHIALNDIKKIPPKVVFYNNGYLDVVSVEEISEDVVLNNGSDLHLGKLLKKVHPTVEIANKGDIIYYGYKIPKGIRFINKGDIDIEFVKEISENVIFNNDGNLLLEKLEKIDPTVEFANDGHISFNYTASKIPKGMIFNNKGSVYVNNVKEISENVIFNNDWDVVFNKQKVIFSKGVRFNNKGDVVDMDIDLFMSIPKFLDPKKYLNKMIEQLYK